VSASAGLRGWRALEVEPTSLALVAVLAAVWIGFDVATEGLFLSPRNLVNLAIQSSVVAIMATGMVLVIVARHIDLSVGSVLGVTGMLAALVQTQVIPADSAWGAPLAVAVALAAGAAIGAWHGFWVAYRGVPAFVVTLAGLLIFRGSAYLVTDGATLAPLGDAYVRLGGGADGSIGAGASWLLAALALVALGAAQLCGRAGRRRHGIPRRPPWAEAVRFVAAASLLLGFVAVTHAHPLPGSDVPRGLPAPVLILALVAACMGVLAHRTRLGRHVFAMGGDPDAAALAGVDVRRTTLAVFVVMGLLAGVAGVLTSARLAAGSTSMGTLAELSVIAAAVIGGTSLAGGVGTVAGALLGALFMQSLENGMVLLGVSSALRQIAIGLVLVAAVWLDVRARGARSG
jgi:D-xylose transport system permease protein